MDALIDEFLKALIALGMFFIPLFGLTVIYEWVAQNRPSWLAAKPQVPPRPNSRIPAHERALLGDDWREPVADYFTPSPTHKRSDHDAE